MAFSFLTAVIPQQLFHSPPPTEAFAHSHSSTKHTLRKLQFYPLFVLNQVVLHLSIFVCLSHVILHIADLCTILDH